MRNSPTLYHAADIVAVPSVIDAHGDRDGLPNVVLEAMACGLAIVGSDVAAIPTAIEHRVTGLLVDPGDVYGLANAINELAKDADLRTALGANARATAEAALRSERLHRSLPVDPRGRICLSNPLRMC